MARLPDTHACITCDQPVGRRRARQGVRQHPACRRRSATPPVDQAFRQTQEVLARLGETSEDEELADLFQQAADAAGNLVKDLEALKEAAPKARAKGVGGGG